MWVRLGLMIIFERHRGGRRDNAGNNDRETHGEE